MPPGREARPPRPPRPDVVVADASAGKGIVTASLAGTALLLVTAVPAAVAPDTLQVAAAVVAIGLFVGGTVTFAWSYAIAIGRSRTEDVTLAGVYGLSGTAPAAVKIRLFGSAVAEAAIALSTAGARVHSALSFGVLAVMWGLGLIGLWGARYGAFPPRPSRPSRATHRGSP